MEYQQKKEQILSTIQYSSLLTFNLVQNKLERNFRTIVEALLLNQTKTDECASKTELIQDKIIADKQRMAQDQEGFKQMLKQLNQRVIKLQHQNNQSSLPNQNQHMKLESSKDVKQNNKQDFSKKSIQLIDMSPSLDKNSILDKKLDDAFHQISCLKEKMPLLKFLEGQFDNVKRDIATLKGELMTYHKSSSSKNIKRESINIAKRESSTKLPKTSTLNHSSSSVLLQQNVNKQNRTEVADQKQSVRIQPNLDEQLQRQFEGLHVEVNTLNLCYQQLKNLVEDLRKKDIKYQSLFSQFEDKHKKMQNEMRKDSQNFEKQFKTIQLDLMNNSNQPALEKVSPNKSSQKLSAHRQSKDNGNSNISEDNINFKNQLNDKLSKFQSSLQNFVSQTQFNRFKAQTRQKEEQIDKKHNKLVEQFQQEIKKIYDMFINKDLDINRLGQLINSTSDTIKENQAQTDRKHNIAIARIEQLKKNLQNLREDVEFYQAMNTQNKQSKDKKVGQPQKITNLQVDGKESKQKVIDNKSLEDLKRSFNNKLHDQRAYLVGLVRDLEKKQQSANGVSQQIANLWDKINEFNVFLAKKADAEDIKKNMIYLEKKINKIGAQFIKSEDNTEDARIARTNWVCLSCDKNLQGYQGKIGKHIVWDSMPLKGAVTKAVEKRGLPSLKK